MFGRKKFDVVGVGLNATDTLIRLPHFPEFDSKVELLSAQVRPGGQVASALVACARWGLTTRYVGKVGDDAAATLQEREFRRAGVKARLLKVANCSSQIAYILIDEKSGERTILWKRDARLTLQPGELKRLWITRGEILLVDGHDTQAATTAARWARAAGIPVVADIDNLYPGVQELLYVIDYLLASRDFPKRLTGEADLPKALRQIQREFKCRVAGATLGNRGVIAMADGRLAYCRAFRVPAADTTGAGDIFHGGFVYGLRQGWDLERALEFSCAAAALNCTQVGARAGIASLTEIQDLINSGERYPAAPLDAHLAERNPQSADHSPQSAEHSRRREELL